MLLKNYRKESVKNMSNKIKDELDQYEIKTSSREILNRFYEVRDSRMKEKKKNYFGLKILSSLLTCAVLVIAFIKIINPTNGHKGVSPSNQTSLPYGAILIEDDKENHVAFQLVSGLSLLDFIDNEATSNLMVKRKQATSTQFGEIVDVFDKANELIRGESFANIDKNVYQGDFNVGDKYYPYMMEIINNNDENIKIYYDSRMEKEGKNETETEFHGEIHFKQNVYSILGDKEVENSDEEFEITIYIDRNNYIEIEQEIENDSYEYQSLIHEKGKKVYEIEYSVEDGRNTLEIRDSSNRYKFDISYKEENTLIEYTFLDYRGTITLRFSEKGRVYTENTTLDEIIKN